MLIRRRARKSRTPAFLHSENKKRNLVVYARIKNSRLSIIRDLTDGAVSRIKMI